MLQLLSKETKMATNEPLDLTRFDAYEVAQVAEFAGADGSTHAERVETLDEGWEKEAVRTYYTVFGHLDRHVGEPKLVPSLTSGYFIDGGRVTPESGEAWLAWHHNPTGGVEEIRDFPTYDGALIFAQTLAGDKPVTDYSVEGEERRRDGGVPWGD
jgi:hypothetical protein